MLSDGQRRHEYLGTKALEDELIAHSVEAIVIAGTKELQDKLSNLRRGLHIAMDELARRDNQNRAREILAEPDTHMTRLINHMKVVEAPSDR